MSNIIALPNRAASGPKKADDQGPSACCAVISLEALLRWSPEKFRPDIVARDLLNAARDGEGNPSAVPVWAARKDAFALLLADRGIPGYRRVAVQQDWRAAVRKAGIAEKARRRTDRENADKFFDNMRNGGDGF